MSQQDGYIASEEYHIARSTGEAVNMLTEALARAADKISEPDASAKDAVMVASQLGEYAEAELTSENSQSPQQDAIGVANELGEQGLAEVDDLGMYSPEKDAIGIVGELGAEQSYAPKGVIDRLNETIENNAAFEYEVVNIFRDINDLTQDQQDAVFVAQNIERFAEEKKDIDSYKRFDDPELFDSFVGADFYETEQSDRANVKAGADKEVADVSLNDRSAGRAEVNENASDQVQFQNTAYTEPDKVYAGERFNVEVKDDIRTITTKDGGVVFQYRDEGGKIEIIQDNMTDKDKAVMREVRENIDAARGKPGGMNEVLSDPTGVSQADTLKDFAPSGSHAISVAGKLTEGSQNEVIGKDFTFRKTDQETYLVLRNDGGIPNEKNVVAESKANGKIISRDQKSAELDRFEKAYKDARNKVLSADIKETRQSKGKSSGRDR